MTVRAKTMRVRCVLVGLSSLAAACTPRAEARTELASGPDLAPAVVAAAPVPSPIAPPTGAIHEVVDGKLRVTARAGYDPEVARSDAHGLVLAQEASYQLAMRELEAGAQEAAAGAVEAYAGDAPGASELRAKLEPELLRASVVTGEREIGTGEGMVYETVVELPLAGPDGLARVVRRASGPPAPRPVILARASEAAPQPAAAAPEPPRPTKTVVATGHADVREGARALACDEARVAAERRAVQEAFGVHVVSETLLEDERVAQSWQRVRSLGLLERVNERSRRVEDGTCTVEIEAEVALALVPEGEDLSELRSLREYRVLIDADAGWEDGDGEPAPDARWARRAVSVALSTALLELGGPEASVTVIEEPETTGLSRLSAETSAERGRAAMADLVVRARSSSHFSETTPIGTSYRTDLALDVVDPAEGRVVLALDLADAHHGDGVKGFGRTEEKAARASLRNALNGLVPELVEHLRERGVGTTDTREVAVEVRGLPDLAALDEVREQLAATRWVEVPEASARRDVFEGSRATLHVRYAERTAFLASALDRHPRLEVRSTERDRIELRYLPHARESAPAVPPSPVVARVSAPEPSPEPEPGVETAPPPAPAPSDCADACTGVIFDLRGLDVGVLVLPRVVDERGREVYGINVVDVESLPDYTLGPSAESLEAARSWGRVGEDPLVVKALRRGELEVDIVIPDEAAERLRDLDRERGLLLGGRVVFLAGPPR